MQELLCSLDVGLIDNLLTHIIQDGAAEFITTKDIRTCERVIFHYRNTSLDMFYSKENRDIVNVIVSASEQKYLELMVAELVGFGLTKVSD